MTMRKILTTSQLEAEKPAETLVGAYRAESTDQNTSGSGSTTKIPFFWIDQRPGLGTWS